MAYISMIDEADAAEPLSKVYQRIGPRIANILKIHGANPAALEAHFDLYRTLMFGESTLTRVDRELIAVVVSHANRCHY